MSYGFTLLCWCCCEWPLENKLTNGYTVCDDARILSDIALYKGQAQRFHELSVDSCQLAPPNQQDSLICQRADGIYSVNSCWIHVQWKTLNVKVVFIARTVRAKMTPQFSWMVDVNDLLQTTENVRIRNAYSSNFTVTRFFANSTTVLFTKLIKYNLTTE